jgi:hypothetical protein
MKLFLQEIEDSRPAVGGKSANCQLPIANCQLPTANSNNNESPID